MKMSELRQGQKAEIVTVELPLRLRERLFAMGLIPGNVVEMQGKAPFGTPLILRLFGYSLSLRREDCEKITVRLL